MKIQNISIYSPLIRTRRGNSTPKINVQAQDSVSFSGLFDRSEKKEYLRKAKKYQRDAQYQLKQNEYRSIGILPKIKENIETAFLTKEYADKNIKQVYDIATVGLHSNFRRIENLDGSFVEFSFTRINQKTNVSSMNEYDEHGHLKRKTLFENGLPSEIKIYKENGKQDIIKQHKFKNTEIRIDYEETGELFESYNAKSVLKFKENQLLSITNGIDSYAKDCVRIDEIFEFSEYFPNKLKELKFNLRKNSLDEKNCDVKYVFSPVGEFEPDEVHYDISQDVHGAKRVGKRFTLRNHGKNVLNIENNYQRSALGEESSDLKYYFSDDKLVQTAVNMRSRGSVYLASEVYRYTYDEQPDSCKLHCKMDTKEEKCFSYRKKFEF